MTQSDHRCPICDSVCSLLDKLDLNLPCKIRGAKFQPSGVLVGYFLCENCGFCFAPEFAAWTPEQFAERIYNDDYVQFDPEYAGERPRTNAQTLITHFGAHSGSIRHLDYGGGDGSLARLLRENDWQSTSYDPYVDRTIRIESLGTFDFITAFEVFEHVPDVRRLMSDLRLLLAPSGIILFSTLVSDGNIQAGRPLDWWYAGPRNGHISLYSTKSLVLLGRRYGMRLASATSRHVFFTEIPAWGTQIFRGV
jgi:SAM-dependent methyltransferase